MSELIEAIMTCNLDWVRELLIQDPPCIDDTNQEGIPMALLAAGTGSYEIVKYIVEYSRASMNTYDGHHRDILHHGAMSGNVALCRYLVEYVGMDPLRGDANQQTPFEVAYDRGHEALVAYFETKIGAKMDQMYKNPIRTGMFPDPSICRVGEDYYMVNSSFVFFPCLPISHSKDLVHWEIIGHGITNPSWANLDDLEGGRGYWAPDISYYQGRFYITATYRLNDTGRVYRKQIIISSDKPEGPYSKPAIIDEDGIDPSIFNDDDGRRYMLLNRGARILELNQEATKQISEAKLLYYGSQKRAPEGPHLLKKDGYYYLFLAEGGTGPGHRITVSRAKSLEGPYEACPYNPIMRQEDPMAALQRTGHGKPVMTQEGDWYMVYLCGRMVASKYTLLGRETALDPITWTKDQWPVVNNLKGPSVLQKRPIISSQLNHNEDKLSEETGFKALSGGLSKEWMFPRPPEKDAYYFDLETLYLKSSPKALETREAKNILLRRQEHFDFEARVTLDCSALREGQEGGIIGYYDENSFFTFFVKRQGSKLSVNCRERIGYEDKHYESLISLDAALKSVTLIQAAYGLERRLFIEPIGQHRQPKLHMITLPQVAYLSDEGVTIGKRFTGAMIGVYAYEVGSGFYLPFKDFKYRNLTTDSGMGGFENGHYKL